MTSTNLMRSTLATAIPCPKCAFMLERVDAIADEMSDNGVLRTSVDVRCTVCHATLMELVFEQGEPEGGDDDYE